VRIAAALAALLLASCHASSAPPALTVRDAWARATLPGQSSTAAYFTLVNAGGPDRLVSVSSSEGDATLHSTAMANGVMRMRPLDGIDVPEGGTVELKPGGTHVMIMGLRQPLAAGGTLALSLRFAKSGELKIDAAVRSAAGDSM
jgi:copper(I)-binding protein